MLKSPFPYFGGKSAIADHVWSRFGSTANYVEPFFGSGAVLLNRPYPFSGTETVNDKCGFISNFWRAVQADPEGVAKHADRPVNENDVHAIHSMLVGQTESMQSKLEGNLDWFDSKIAGLWCFGLCCWIGSGWCSGKGPWHVVDGELIRVEGDESQGVKRQLPHLGNAGRGVNRKLPHLGDAGRGVNRKLPHLGDAGRGVLDYFAKLSDRLRRVRVCCGDWTRVCGPTPTTKQGLTAVFLDPPYAAEAGRDNSLYRQESTTVAHAVREWAIEHGDDPEMRIALCGYEGEHVMPDSWECVSWKARGGYASQSTKHDNPNAGRERIWYSPHCIKPKAVADRQSLFAEAT